MTLHRRRPPRRAPVGPRPVDRSLPALTTVGFWFNPQAPNPYPRPELLVGGWDAAVKAAVLAHLRAGSSYAVFAGYSFCRFRCGVAGAALGCQDLTDGTYDWPSGLAHYVEVHDVRLPDDFVAHVLAGAPPREVTRRTTRLDDGPWLAWGRAQGACLDLAGWEVPGWDDRTRILALLAEPDAELLLARADTRHVVIARAGGALEIRQLTPDPQPPRTLPGWDAWPRLR